MSKNILADFFFSLLNETKIPVIMKIKTKTIGSRKALNSAYILSKLYPINRLFQISKQINVHSNLLLSFFLKMCSLDRPSIKPFNLYLLGIPKANSTNL